MDPTLATLSAQLDDLEYHRAFDVGARLTRSIELAREAADAGAPELRMRARLVEADMRLRGGAAAEAAAIALEVSRWADENGWRPLLARSFLIRSSIFESIGDSASDLDFALRALELIDEDAPARVRGNFLLRLADALSVAGSLESARQRYGEAETLFESVPDVERQLGALNNLAFAESQAGHPDRAWEAAAKMRDLARAHAVPLSPPLLDTLAGALVGLGQPELAQTTLETGLDALRVVGDIEADTEAGLLLTLGGVQLVRGHFVEAQATLERCRTICTERGLGSLLAETDRVSAQVYAAEGRFEDAYEAFRRFHDAFVALSSAHREADARTRQALFETVEARQDAERFWRQARTDALSGLPNRRYLDEELPHRLAEVATGMPLVVAIVDADHFKLVNDTFSHDIGDQVIRQLARVLATAASAGSDPAQPLQRLVGRLGGEEFLVVLSGVELPAATDLLEGLRRAVDEHDWAPLTDDLPITVSVGATRARPGDESSELMGRADLNLYVAKAGGRNRVVIDAPESQG